MNLRTSGTKQLTVIILYIVYKHLRPPTGVKAGKRNKTSPLDDRFCRSAHCLWAAVAQVVLVVRELLLVSEWCKILGWETGSSQGTNVLKDCCKPESQVTWYLLTIPFSRPIYILFHYLVIRQSLYVVAQLLGTLTIDFLIGWFPWMVMVRWILGTLTDF